MYKPDVKQFNSKISYLIERLRKRISFEIIIHDDSAKLNYIVKDENIHYQLNKPGWVFMKTIIICWMLQRVSTFVSMTKMIILSQIILSTVFNT